MQETLSEVIVQKHISVETTFEKTNISEPKPFRWTKSDYHKMAELGMFEGKRTEFLEGEIIEMPTMKSPHAVGLALTDTVLRAVFSKDYFIRNQMPLDLSDEFEAVPDVAIVPGAVRDYVEAHPKTAELVVEISDTTLSYDRNRKASLYTRFGISDYWVLNLKNRTLEVYRQPVHDENAFYGFIYGEKLTLSVSDEIAPLAAAGAKIKVADLLP